MITKESKQRRKPIRQLDRLCRKLVMDRLQHLAGGRLVVSDASGSYEFGSLGSAGINAELEVHDGRFYRALATGGVLGAAEAYQDGQWHSADLVKLVRLFSRNIELAGNLGSWLAVPRRLVHRLGHRIRRNSKAGSRQNIAAHYDLGNSFFSLFLDETMSYSAGVFERPDCSLTEASLAKNELICDKLALHPSDHVLEIGGGWGGFATHAAQRYGCRVTTTTISNEQYQFARRRVERAGLADRVRVLRRDYRDLEGTYDKLVSVEMIEAVGHDFLDTYFAVCARHLKPGGSLLLQAITIDDRRYERYRRSVDFIQRTIFPGGCLPSLARIHESAARAGGLSVREREPLGLHYAETLSRWRHRFLAKRRELSKLGLSDEFQRMWEFYFAYCEGGFREEAIDVSQIIMAQTARRATERAPMIPSL